MEEKKLFGKNTRIEKVVEVKNIGAAEVNFFELKTKEVIVSKLTIN